MGHKACNQCFLEKDISEDFYETTPSKCKECVKANVRARELIKLSTPEGIEKERERHRNKYHRLGYKDVHKPTPENKKLIQERYKNKYPEKIIARNKCTELKASVKGNQLHHWNYNLDYTKDVIELTEKDHNTLHRKLEYDTVNFIYNTLDGIPLDTKEKHENYIKQLQIEIYN